MPKKPTTPKDAVAFVNGATAAWKSDLILSDKGLPRALLANAIIAFRAAPEWANILAYDAFHQRTMLRGKAPWLCDARNEPWLPSYDTLATDWLQHEGILVQPQIAGQAIEVVARDRLFHPVLDYLARCEWDGTPRLDTWTVDYLGVADTLYVRAVSARWMIGLVARVSEPGRKFDTALILEGKQNIGKSTALRVLGDPWYTDEIADFGSKDAAMQMAGVWIIELAELDGISRGEVSRIKAFMSRATDRYRPAYGHRVIEQPRQCGFGGTVNGSEYLRDESGGRRWWPIGCTRINTAGLGAVRDQLWAEARHRYAAGETWWLEGAELNRAASAEQRGRYQSDPWEKAVADWVAGKESASVTEVLRNAIGIGDISEWTQTDQNRVARCLKALGWERLQRRRTAEEIDQDPGSTHEWRYWPPVDDDE